MKRYLTGGGTCLHWDGAADIGKRLSQSPSNTHRKIKRNARTPHALAYLEVFSDEPG